MEPMTTDTTLLIDNSDSLRQAIERLFVAGAHYTPADSLASAAPTATVGADALYGAGSYLAAQPAAEPYLCPPAHDFQALLLLLGIVYLLLLSHHLGNIYTLLLQTTSRTAVLRPSDPRSGSSFTAFQRLSIVIGMLFVGLLGMRLAAPQSFAPNVPQVTFSLLISAGVGTVLLLQNGMLRLAGAITVTQEFTNELIATKRSLLALGALLLPPTLLCYILTPAGSGAGWLIAILAETAIVLFLFLKATLSLFVSKKVSIFHWILYLCTVEIFPISLLWLLIARN